MHNHTKYNSKKRRTYIRSVVLKSTDPSKQIVNTQGVLYMCLYPFDTTTVDTFLRYF